MNIFVLDRDPNIAARLMCDKHVVKMVTETAQLLSTAHRVLDGRESRARSISGKRLIKHYGLYGGANDHEMEGILYKATNINHPCSVWTRETSSNYTWLYQHFIALCNEYSGRYERCHKSHLKLLHPLGKLPVNIKQESLTEFPQAMPDDCKQEDVALAYQTYYNRYKSGFAKWKSGSVPEWFRKDIV